MDIEKTPGISVARQKASQVCAKALAFAMLIFLATGLPAQKIWDERAGCIAAQGNLAPGYLFSSKSATAYVDGDIDIFIDNHFSATGSIWVSFAMAQAGPTGLKINDAMFWGADYHFLKPSHWDPFVEFTPGVGLVQVAYSNGEILKRTPYTPVPLASASIGCNYYVGSIFHFFLKIQGVTGQVSSTLPTTMRLDELKFMAGLGYNIRAWKPKKRI